MHQRALMAAIAIGITSTCQAADNTVYRCEQGGKITYTDDPCLNAKEVDVTPTEGMNKWTGKTREDPKLQAKRTAEFQNQAIGRAMRPITGMDEKAWDTATKQQARAPEIRGECKQLDQQLPNLKEAAAHAKNGVEKDSAEMTLYKARKRFKELKC